MKVNHFSLPAKSLFAASLLSAFVLSGCESSLDKIQEDPTTQSQSADAQGESGKDYVANELLVKFKPGLSEEAKSNALARISGKVSEKILTKAMERAGEKEGLMVVHTPMAALEALSKVKGGPEIEFAEPNYLYQHTAATNDTYVANGALWGMDGNIYGSQASTAWAAGTTGSKSVVVGIIDEGIQFDHPDLAGQIWTNPYDPADGVDNDGNGYIDDIHGWDFDGNNNSIYDGTKRGSSDDHGTHVAGTIGANANNGAGVAGLNWNITIISTKFLGRQGGTTANAVKAVDYLNDLKTRHNMNIVASNNSWGGGGFSQALSDAVDRANAKNILFIAAAGNGGSDGVGDDNDAVASFPSNLPQANVIAVAAITSTGLKSGFSNFGATTVDIGAPGSGIWSSTAFNIYESYNGTSMATPHVTGAAALYASTHPGATAAQIKNALLSSAVPTASLAGKCVTGGRLDANAALTK
ncbi:peptidase S8 and S53 subtilisin kexin sedolisin [Hymenobacter roseosalivarius DSM 11622]|uniref:Peptidase S8 and S53 subtilisin kexin sedolisin n=1 Tax=Hymenobacter roseosalivarius DSM 11622 TaxID=645990 RepID=A0A1W1VQ64_9BACT|nr:peptidase S8 and S53 subtilisin kexin sedolisin [Hymenobacter roseosalivarius DSM 11622]